MAQFPQMSMARPVGESNSSTIESKGTGTQGYGRPFPVRCFVPTPAQVSLLLLSEGGEDLFHNDFDVAPNHYSTNGPHVRIDRSERATPFAGV